MPDEEDTQAEGRAFLEGALREDERAVEDHDHNSE